MRMPLVFEKFVRVVRAHSLLDRGDRVLVAVSGGADSVALLSLLLEVRAQFELDLIVAHLNHNLRGKASDEDEEFVRILAQDLGIRFISERIPAEDVKVPRKWPGKLGEGTTICLPLQSRSCCEFPKSGFRPHDERPSRDLLDAPVQRKRIGGVVGHAI